MTEIPRLITNANNYCISYSHLLSLKTFFSYFYIAKQSQDGHHVFHLIKHHFLSRVLACIFGQNVQNQKTNCKTTEISVPLKLLLKYFTIWGVLHFSIVLTSKSNSFFLSLFAMSRSNKYLAHLYQHPLICAWRSELESYFFTTCCIPFWQVRRFYDSDKNTNNLNYEFGKHQIKYGLFSLFYKP